MHIDRTAARSMYERLTRLYDEERQRNDNQYLREHGQAHVVRHQVNVFCWYAQQLPESGAFLDWGCNHGPDSCLLRHQMGDSADLYACDFTNDDDYPVFRQFAVAQYRKLTDIVELPYPDSSFDAVIGSGVLEHVAMDYESLKEVYRVLKPGGLLVVSYLPHALSWTEWYRRAIRKEGFHRRLYRKSVFAQLLKSTGFYPEFVGYHTGLPDWLNGSRLRSIQKALSRRLSPVFRHDIIRALARKMHSM
jgi:ubiquinone/menaquinone biosynthesis C-methylase UbiE